MDLKNILKDELGIIPGYARVLKKNRAICMVHSKWLDQLKRSRTIPEEFPLHSDLTESECEVFLYQGGQMLPDPWTLLVVQAIPKMNGKVKRFLEQQSSEHSKDLSFSELIHYISDTNYKKMWKDTWKRYRQDAQDTKQQCREFQSYNSAVRKVICKLYGVTVIQPPTMRAKIQQDSSAKPHPNLLPLHCALETGSWFFLLHHNYEFTLKDCISFSPAVLGLSTVRLLFVLYQLLHAVRDLHDRGLHCGNLTPWDVAVNQKLWVKVLPCIWDDLLREAQSNEARRVPDPGGGGESVSVEETETVRPKGSVPLNVLVENWVEGRISNFDYLLELNKLAGREPGNPRHHPVVPWIMDFTVPEGGWRDLSKSKYRLNKGDRQLDVTYESARSHAGSITSGNVALSLVSSAVQVPHHVSEVLSDITYYVYKARQMPKSILCKHVRSKWVPAEYPTSMQRMQEWTPDECIPEFYADPSIFRSIHGDLPDIEVPWWSSGPEDFIRKHREVLESDQVSEYLNHWIDLTFGYRLSGGAAVKSKNVCLPLVDHHTTLSNCGMVQLFFEPHPHKRLSSLYAGKNAPSTFRIASEKLFLHSFLPKEVSIEKEHNATAQELSKDVVDEDHSASDGAGSLKVGRQRILRSKSLVPTTNATELVKEEVRPENQTIILPKDYNPLAALNQVESLFSFISHTTGSIANSVCVQSTDEMSQRQKRKSRDMVVLGCLTIQMALSHKLRVLPPELSLEETYNFLVRISSPCDREIPRCVQHVVRLLLHVGTSKDGNCLLQPRQPITSDGLPQPSAQQLLQPLLDIVPFPAYFGALYRFVCRLLELSQQIEVTSPDEVDAVVESQVLFAASSLPSLLCKLNAEGIDLLTPYLQELFVSPSTSLLAVWHLFGPISQALGPHQTSKKLLNTLTSLLDPERTSHKHLKLYHRSCLLQYIVRLGMPTFLAHFTTLLIEATGGFRDYTAEGILRSQGRDSTDSVVRKGSHLHSPELEHLAQESELAAEGTISPYDEDSLQNDLSAHKNDAEPELFAFESGEIQNGNAMSSLVQEQQQPKDDKTVEKVTSVGNHVWSAEENGCNLQDDDYVGAFEVSMEDTIADGIADEEDGKAEETHESPKGIPMEAEDPPNRFLGKASEYNISDVALESVVWLAHRLGPVLTAKYLSRNLLRMLTLCYLGSEQQKIVPHSPTGASSTSSTINMKKWVVGDRNANKVLECLSSIVELYGENFIVLQYFPHAVDLVSLCKRRITETLEAGLIGSLSLIQHVVPFLSDATLMDHLQPILIKDILYPTVRLVSSLRLTFPGGGRVRGIVAGKLINVLYLVGIRIGFEMTRKHLSAILQRFFASFNRAHENLLANIGNCGSHMENTGADDYLEIKKNEESDEYVIGTPVCINMSMKSSIDSLSPPVGEQKAALNPQREKALEELRDVFTPEMAYLSYVHFCKLAGGIYMEQTLKNDELIRQLCLIHDNLDNSGETSFKSLSIEPGGTFQKGHRRAPSKDDGLVSGEFGKNVAVIGNRIDINLGEDTSLVDAASTVDGIKGGAMPPCDIIRKLENNRRHLKGNWLAYWEHEIGRSEKDQRFNFKQIKLQSFVGHGGGIRAIHVLDNENSFLTGSKDKTVKLWSLRSCGDGTAQTPCQWTYNQHRKSVFSVAFLDSMRLVGSCDSTVHIWDPFLGSCIRQLDSSKSSPVTLLTAMPAPCPVFLAATTNSTVRFLDVRTCRYMHEFKVSLGPTGLIRCLSVSPNGHWIAVGHSSGVVSVLDVRTGMLFGSRTCHEGEILQLKAFNNVYFVSSSLDHNLSVWNAEDIKLKCHLRGPMEPVTCLNFYKGEVITGTTANRIGVHTAIDNHAAFSSVRLLADTFKGVLTSMAVLPLNRVLLLGADNGTLSLLC